MSRYLIKGKDKVLDVHLTPRSIDSWVKLNGQDAKITGISLDAQAGDFVAAKLRMLPSEVNLIAEATEIVLEEAPSQVEDIWLNPSIVGNAGEHIPDSSKVSRWLRRLAEDIERGSQIPQSVEVTANAIETIRTKSETGWKSGSRVSGHTYIFRCSYPAVEEPEHE